MDYKGRDLGRLELNLKRNDNQTFSVVDENTNDETDYKFGEALRAAKVAGVDIFAYNCLVTEESIEINQEVEIIL